MDVILWPARDAEVVQVVERALHQTHETRVRLQLDRQLEAANQELQRKVHQLTTILSIGKAVTSTTDPRRLFDLIVEGAMQVAEAETSWLMIRDENTRAFLLTAHHNLPESWGKKINQPLDDGISSLVAVSAETLSIHGTPLEKFKVASLGRSAAVVPIKVQSEVIGLLIVVRKADREIDKVAQSLLEAVADYASISLVNGRLFQVVQQNAEAARTNEKNRMAMFEIIKGVHSRGNAGFHSNTFCRRWNHRIASRGRGFGRHPHRQCRRDDCPRTSLLAAGAKAVLVKGGHLDHPDAIDILVEASGIETFTGQRIATKHSHGTGCSLASAIAAGLAQGMPLRDATSRAIAYEFRLTLWPSNWKAC